MATKLPRCQVLFQPKVYAEMKVLALSDRRTLSAKCAELIEAAMKLPEYRELFVKAMQLPEYQELYANESGIPMSPPNPELVPGDRANFRAVADQAYAAAANAQPNPEAKPAEEDALSKELNDQVIHQAFGDKGPPAMPKSIEEKKQMVADAKKKSEERKRKKAAEDAIHPSMQEVLPELEVLLQAMANLKS